MSIKSRNILMIIGGGYLIYIGTRLVMQTGQSHPQNETLFVAFGVGFAVFGALVTLFNLWEIWKDTGGRKKEDDDSYVEIIELDDEPEPVAEKTGKRKNHVQMVSMKQREDDNALDIEHVKEELSAEETSVTEEKPVADVSAGENETDESQTEVAFADNDVLDENTKDRLDAEAEPDETLEELELSPDEAEDAFPTEEIKLERI